jgi:hypothetical protein
VVSIDVLEMREMDLQTEVLKLRRRLRVVGAIVGLLLALLRAAGMEPKARLLPGGEGRPDLLKAIERARSVLSLRTVLRIVGTSPSQFHAWRNAENTCSPADRTGCPKRQPNQLTPEEILTIQEMVTSAEYRHVPTSRLAVLEQRLGRVFASPSNWGKLVRDHGWRRPRTCRAPRTYSHPNASRATN